MYVTPSVYENIALVRRHSNDTLIFLGPIFIHGHSDLLTYSEFFGHLSSKLANCNLGSDDEYAVQKSFSYCFHRAATIVCVRHLKEIVLRQLDSLVGKSSAIRCDVLHGMFGEKGLVA